MTNSSCCSDCRSTYVLRIGINNWNNSSSTSPTPQTFATDLLGVIYNEDHYLLSRTQQSAGVYVFITALLMTLATDLLGVVQNQDHYLRSRPKQSAGVYVVTSALLMM